ncbi:MAG: hypothetical protein ACRYGG_01075 [Janthinobacterium lividum]
MMQTSELWQPIETAPKDGTFIRYQRRHEGKTIFQGKAVWREVEFLSFVDRHGLAPGFIATGWMYIDKQKRVPEPTHWMLLP